MSQRKRGRQILVTFLPHFAPPSAKPEPPGDSGPREARRSRIVSRGRRGNDRDPAGMTPSGHANGSEIADPPKTAGQIARRGGRGLLSSGLSLLGRRKRGSAAGPLRSRRRGMARSFCEPQRTPRRHREREVGRTARSAIPALICVPLCSSVAPFLRLPDLPRGIPLFVQECCRRGRFLEPGKVLVHKFLTNG